VQAPASLPSNPCEPGEEPERAAVRMAREMTGLNVEVIREFFTFIQEARQQGPCAHTHMSPESKAAF
jgi:ADP-ribose pyrophosphatase YjhB (NUDIX family)